MIRLSDKQTTSKQTNRQKDGQTEKCKTICNITQSQLLKDENDILQDINNMGESATRSVENGLSMKADQNTPTKRSKISSSQKIKSKKHSESTSTHDESISNGETIDSTKEHKHQENILGGENSSNSEAVEDRSIKHVNNCELKKNEIRSKLQTCIAVCFPSLEDQDREKKFDDDELFLNFKCFYCGEKPSCLLFIYLWVV